MGTVTLSPNMSLPVPTVGGDPSPTYAFDVNSALTIVDQHNHSPGSGVQITPAGLNINTSLPMNNNFLINSAGLTLTAQSVTPANNTLYESGVDLYYTDGVGNNVRITQSGGVAGSPGSISNLNSPASASYVSGSQTFVWQSGASIAANMDFGSAIMRNLSPNSTFALTLQPPAALASNYSLTLPTIPAAQQFMTIDASGNIAGYANVSGGLTTNNINNSLNTNNFLAGSLNGSVLVDGSVGYSKTTLTQAFSASCGTFISTSTTFATITNLSVSISTTGRPVCIMLINSTLGGAITAFNTSGPVATAEFRLLQSGVPIMLQELLVGDPGSGATANAITIPTGAINHICIPAGGTYTWTLQARVSAIAGSPTVAVENAQLFVYEL